jgi:hypothetical protein
MPTSEIRLMTTCEDGFARTCAMYAAPYDPCPIFWTILYFVSMLDLLILKSKNNYKQLSDGNNNVPYNITCLTTGHSLPTVKALAGHRQIFGHGGAQQT